MAGNANSGRRQMPEELMRLKGTLQPSRPRTKGLSGKKITEIMNCTQIAGYKDLSKRARTMYLSACRQVMSFRLLEHGDLPQLLIYAKEFDRYLQCDEDLNANGRYKYQYDEDREIRGTVENPSFRQMMKCWDVVKAISSNYGFSPYDRQRLKAETDPEDPTTKIVNIIMNGGTDGPDDQ